LRIVDDLIGRAQDLTVSRVDDATKKAEKLIDAISRYRVFIFKAARG